MKALKLIPKYLWQYKFVIALLFVFTAVFALIAYLYQMAVEAILYAFALCFTIIIILVAIHFYLYCKKHFERIRLLNYPLTLQLPIPQNLTEAELYRKIEELDIADYIEIKGYRIEESGKGFPEEEGMDWFAGNSLFPMEGRRILLLNFAEKEKGNYLNDSMVCFAVSHLQAQIGEYRCIGALV